MVEKMNKKVSYYFREFVDYPLIALYLYTACIKILKQEEFRIKLLKSPLINPDLIPILIYAVPVFELVIVVLLFTRFKLVGHLLSIFLLTIFIVYIYLLNKHSIYNGCGCGGIFEKLSLGKHILVNCIFIILSSIYVLLYKKPGMVNNP
jgi:hypothetical protein